MWHSPVSIYNTGHKEGTQPCPEGWQQTCYRTHEFAPETLNSMQNRGNPTTVLAGLCPVKRSAEMATEM